MSTTPGPDQPIHPPAPAASAAPGTTPLAGGILLALSATLTVRTRRDAADV